MTDVPLRERSKAKRRAAIEEAAWRLFAVQGFEQTTLPEIAAAAEVSPRTVSLYFPSKTDLALSSAAATMASLANALDEQNLDRPVLDVVQDWFRVAVGQMDETRHSLQVQMFAANPRVEALLSIETERALMSGGRALSRELGLPEGDPRVAIALAGIAGVLNYLGTRQRRDQGTETMLEAAMLFLSAGIQAIEKTTL